MARIPITHDVAALIGDFAEGVENRSLLLEKFMFHKDWGLDGLRANDAHRWSILRVTDGGGALLKAEAARRREQANGRNVEEHNKQRLRAEADLADRLSASRLETEATRDLRIRQSREFVARFRESLGTRCGVVVAKLEGRLAINLADGLIQNAGICLDRLFGLPYIPGSAVKGVARHAALEHTKADPSALPFLDRVFGTTEKRGAICFLSAHPVSPARVVVDLTNVHFPDYYRSGNPADLKNEKPLPNPFPAVESAAHFAFCFALNGIDEDSALLMWAETWIKAALSVHGLGAKTASGYGWFSMDESFVAKLDAEREAACRAEQAREQAAAEERTRVQAEIDRKAALTPEQAATEEIAKLDQEGFAKKASVLKECPEAEQRAFLSALLSPQRKEAWKTWKKSDKPASKARVELLRALAAKHGIALP